MMNTLMSTHTVILILSSNREESDRITAFLAGNQYRSESIQAVEALDASLSRVNCRCVILDLDSIRIDNRTIRELTLQFPHVCFLCMSSDRFHPELKDAICYHIYACLVKPLDYDELLYWLRCIDDNNNDDKEERPYPS